MQFTQNVEAAIKQAIKNSENMNSGFYQFTDFLKDQNNNLVLDDVEMKTAEYEFYYAVKVGNAVSYTHLTLPTNREV